MRRKEFQMTIVNSWHVSHIKWDLIIVIRDLSVLKAAFTAVNHEKSKYTQMTTISQQNMNMARSRLDYTDKSFTDNLRYEFFKKLPFAVKC